MVSTRLPLLNTRPCLLLCLCRLHRRHVLLQPLRTHLRRPRPRSIITKQHFNLFDRLAARLRIREPELDRSGETQRPEDDEQAPPDVEKRGRDEEAYGEVEEPE
jgi:hypothetical protein